MKKIIIEICLGDIIPELTVYLYISKIEMIRYMLDNERNN